MTSLCLGRQAKEFRLVGVTAHDQGKMTSSAPSLAKEKVAGLVNDFLVSTSVHLNTSVLLFMGGSYELLPVCNLTVSNV